MSQFHIKLSVIVLASLAVLIYFFMGPVLTQNPEYHQFIDTRMFLGIPNTQDVLSNIFFVIVGALGLKELLKVKTPLTKAWPIFFISILLVAPGSAYYHWAPDNFTLVWDRLPMSLGFMALYIVLFSEHVSLKAEKFLPWALLMGIASVLVWVVTTDLRFYFWIQFSSFLTIPLILMLFPSRFTHKYGYGLTLLAYGFAKWAEVKDKEIFQGTNQLLSGHTLKHMLAALGIAGLWWMIKVRKEVSVATN